MKIHFITLLIGSFTVYVSCSQVDNTNTKEENIIKKEAYQKHQALHEFGGWHCPDNLKGFPPVDLKNWDKVSVVNGRLPTEEETQNGTSLIYFDIEKYPDARPMNIEMPQLARFYNEYTKRDELIIVIEAVSVQSDTIAGFRYLHGGNGSAVFNKLYFLAEEDIEELQPTSFVTFDIQINATQDQIWKVMTEKVYSKELQLIFDKENSLPFDWKEKSKVNFKYLKNGITTSEYAAKLFGSYYAQIDYDYTLFQHVEKFLLLEDVNKERTTLKIVCGPYWKDYEEQNIILNDWAKKIKKLSETNN